MSLAQHHPMLESDAAHLKPALVAILIAAVVTLATLVVFGLPH